MRSSPLKRTKGLERRTPLKASRKPLKRKVERDWSDAWGKCEREEVCRNCGAEERLDPAHTIGREYDTAEDTKHDGYVDYTGDGYQARCFICAWTGPQRGPDEKPIARREGLTHSEILYVNPDSILPLCRRCHGRYDRHEIDVLHLLTLDEQLDAVKRAGGLELARVRLCPTAYRDAA